MGTCKLPTPQQPFDKTNYSEPYQGFCCFLRSVFGKIVSTAWTDSWFVPVCIHVITRGVLAFPSAT